MAGYEATHGAQLRARRKELFKDAPSRMTIAMLDDVEAPDRGSPRVYMSARDAMEVALHSEEKAWSFFDEAMKHVKDPPVRALFEELRDEEKEHAKLLKARLKKLPAGPDLSEAEADQPGSDGG
jgi:rubrerythrin